MDRWQSEAFWQFWQRLMEPPEPIPAHEPSAWDIEKAANRLQRQVERAASGKWLPRVPFKLSGRAIKEYQASVALLGEARQAIKGG